jgi:hypothetical protein
MAARVRAGAGASNLPVEQRDQQHSDAGGQLAISSAAN